MGSIGPIFLIGLLDDIIIEEGTCELSYRSEGGCSVYTWWSSMCGKCVFCILQATALHWTGYRCVCTCVAYFKPLVCLCSL